MLFKFTNIGPVDNAEIKLDGVTILAGNNGTGKSTIGKSIFCLLNLLHLWNGLYNASVSKYISDFLHEKSVELDDYCLSAFNLTRRRKSQTDSLINEYSNSSNFRIAIEKYQLSNYENNSKVSEKNTNFERVKEILREYLKSYIYIYVGKKSHFVAPEEILQLTNWIKKVANDTTKIVIDERIVQANLLRTQFIQHFLGDVTNFKKESSSIMFVDNNGRDSILDISNGFSISNVFSFSNDVVFFSSPYVLDIIANENDPFFDDPKICIKSALSPNPIKLDKSTYVLSKLGKLIHNAQNEKGDIIDSIPNDSLINELERIIGGSTLLKKTGFAFVDDTMNTVKINNISSGIKVISTIELALKYDAIRPNDLLIFDEPEINLHPDWQIKLAKFLIDLQKTYKCTILISSHSPYFIRAIELYCDKEKIMDKLNVYLLEKNASGEVVSDEKSNSEYGMRDIYDKLSDSLDRLEQEILGTTDD